MSRPFILLRNSTWKCIPKQGQYGPAVYFADPVKQLQAWEVSEYIATAEGALTISLPIPTPMPSEDTTIEDSDDDLDGTQRLLESSFDARGTSSRDCVLGRQQPYSPLPATWSNRSRDAVRSVRPRIQLASATSCSEPAPQPTADCATQLNETSDLCMFEPTTDIGGSSPAPAIGLLSSPPIGNPDGASASNPVNLDDDTNGKCAPALHSSRSLSRMEEETIVALDKAWTKATKEYNALCTDEFPDAVIASMARQLSPEENSKDTFW